MSDVLKALADHRDYRGMKPFGSANDAHASDRASQILGAASSILKVMSVGAEDAQSAMHANNDCSLETLNFEVLAGALDGVRHLVDFATFLIVEGED